MFSYFEPDTDYADFGYGHFVSEDGERRYGYDPELAEQLPQRPPQTELAQQRLAQAALEDTEQSLAPAMPPPPDAAAADFSTPLDTTADDLSPEQPEQEPGEDWRPPMADDDWTPPMADDAPPPAAAELLDIPGLGQTSPEFRSELVRVANESGLDPNKLAAVMSFETGGSFSASVLSGGDAGGDQHGGLIQFSKKNLPAFAKGTALEGVSFEQLRNLKPEEQLPLVAAYYQRRGITADSPVGDYYLATISPAHLGDDDEKVRFSADSESGRPTDAKNARLDRNKDGRVNAYEQNAGLDRNKDGVITVGEMRNGSRVAEIYGQAMAKAGLAQAGEPAAPGWHPPMADDGELPAMGMQDGSGMPNVPGLALAGATMRGTPLSQQQIEQRFAGMDQGLQAHVAQLEAAATKRAEARAELAADLNTAADARQREAQARQLHNQQAEVDARGNIQRILEEPAQKLDSNRFMRNLSVGEGIASAIAVGLGQWSSAMAGGPNVVQRMLERKIDGDIADQRAQIQAGQVKRNNLLAHYTRELGSIQQGEEAVRYMMREAAAKHAEATKLGLANVDDQARADEVISALRMTNDQAKDKILAREQERLQMQFSPPKVVEPEVGPLSIGQRRALSPEQNRRLAMQWQKRTKPEQRNRELTAIKNDISNVQSLKNVRRRLLSLYGDPKQNEKGEYPPHAFLWQAKGDHDYASTATGTAWNPTNWDIFSDERDRQLEQAWAQLKLAGRMAWKSEPNSARIQNLFQNLGTPDRDNDVPILLRQLDEKIEQAERLVISGTNPGAWSYYKSTSPDASPATRVQTRVKQSAVTPPETHSPARWSR